MPTSNFYNVMRKIAAENDLDKPAMVGRWPNIKSAEAAPIFTPFGDNSTYSSNAYFRALYDPRQRMNNVTASDIPQVVSSSGYFRNFQGKPITKRGLEELRNEQAITNASRIFDQNTTQFNSAVQYLKDRGRANAQYFREGVLYPGGPRPKSRIQLPNNIKDPAARKRLENMGNVQVNNNMPGGRRNTGYGTV